MHGSGWMVLTEPKEWLGRCQQNYENVGFSVEDEVIGKSGPVINACRECAGPEVVSSSCICASREFSQSQKGRESVERYTRAIKLFNNQGTTAVIESFGQIDFSK